FVVLGEYLDADRKVTAVLVVARFAVGMGAVGGGAARVGNPWTADDQRRFDRYLVAVRRLHRVTPWIWPLLWKSYLLDLRTRRHLGLRVF
ncbi:hypothetical protein R3Q17_43720, partial [Rhodococcus opacus]|nr:hypothetical protein [Rhodococcus opacus]